MSRLFKSVFIIFFIFFGFCYAHKLTFTQEEKNYIKNNEVKVALLKNFYPFVVQEEGVNNGFTVDLLTLISKKSNLKIKFFVDTWPNNFHDFKNKKIDIITEISHTQQREKYINFTNAYFKIPLAIYSTKNFENYDNSLQSLKGKKVGITKDVYFTKTIEDLNLFQIVKFDSAVEKLTALELNKIDLAIGNLLGTQELLATKNYNNIKVLDEFKTKSLKKEDLRFGIHKDNPILFEIVNKTYNSLNAKELSQIKNKWMGAYPKSLRTIYNGEIDLTNNERKFLKNKRTIKMCNIHSFAPIEFINKNNQIAGISVDTIRLIEKKLNYNIMIQHVRTSSSQQSREFFEKGICDIMPISISNFNDNTHQYTIPYLHYEPVLITRKDEPFISSLDDIKYKGISVKRNPHLINRLKRIYPGIKLDITDTYKESFERVSFGQSFATVSILPVATYNISKYSLSNLKVAGHENNDITFSIIIKGNENNHLLSILNKSLNAITQREKSEIFNKWANIKYDEKVDYSKLINLASVAILIIILLAYRQLILSKNNDKLQKAKKKLEESNNHFKAIFESTVESIFISNDQGIIVECNEMCCTLFGYKREELLGMDMYRLVHEDYRNIVKEKREHNTKLAYEIYSQLSDGSSIPVLVRGSNILRNNEPHRVSITLDLSQLKQTQKALENLNKELAIKVMDEVEKNKNKDLKLLQQARHAQMGELISMIAHQWRQPLNAIAATVMNLQLQISLDKFDFNKEKDRVSFFDFINLKLENIEDFIQTLSMTIDDFRNFYKPNNLSKITMINVPIDKALSITKALILSKKIELNLNLNSKKDIEIFESELLQVFLNLIKNAQDNFEDRNISHPTITINSNDMEDGVKVEVLDNGGGINLEIINNIFDPYFSTKDIKNGTGLGLYMSKTIIEEHHKGKLYVQNLKNGVCFTIELHDSVK